MSSINIKCKIKTKIITKRFLLVLLLVAQFVIPSITKAQIANATSSGLADSPWPMLHHDLRHTGLSPYSTRQVDGTVKWTYETGAGIESSPTIGSDGTIYIGSHDNKLYAINPDGTLKWKFNAGEPVYIKGWDVWKGIPSAPTIDKNGKIYFVSPPTYLFALNSDGKEIWRYPIYAMAHIADSPVIVPDGTIYVGSESYPHDQDAKQEFGARVYALNSNGTLKWRYDTNGSCLGNLIAIASDGTLYATGSDFLDEKEEIFRNAVTAFNPDGSIKWKYKIERVEGPPSIAEDGTIYVGTKNGKLYALNPDGSQKWVFQTGAGISVMTAIGRDGKIYFGSWDGNFYALNPKGKELWRFDTKKGRDPKIFELRSYKETIVTSAAISNDGTIYFGDVIDTFYTLDLNGKEKWRYTAGGGFVSSPAIGSDGTVYVGSWDKKLYAFSGSSSKEDLAERVGGEKFVIITVVLFLMTVSAIIVIRKKFKRT